VRSLVREAWNEAGRPANGPRLGPAAPLALTAAVVIYGNLATLVLGESAPLLRAAANLALLAITVAIALRLGLGARALGLDRSRPLRGWRWGVAVGLPIGLGFAALALAFAAATGEPIEYAAIAERSAPELAVRIAVLFPLQTAIPEEIVFRGVLLAVWARAVPPAGALLVSSAAFGLWHLAVAWDTAGGLEGGGTIAFQAATYAAFLAGLTAAGMAFGVLRAATGGMAAPALAHWLAVAPVRVAIWLAG
jgi:membrane protease YdiL (CAAX protease family)